MKQAFLRMIAALLAALCLLPAGVLAANPEVLTAELEPAAGSAVFEGEETEPNDALFSEYVLRRFYGSDTAPASAGDPARDRLNQSERKLYDLLKPKLAAVAENGGATQFSFSLEELGVKARWTEAELKQAGLSVPGSSEELSGAVNQILQREFPADSQAVRNALLADLPYELYWFDKTTPAKSGPAGSFGFSNGALDLSGLRFAFDFPAAEGYRDASGEEGGLYTVTSDVAAVKTAVENAQGIVSKFQDQNDYTKLLGYRSEICDRVSYHKEAAGGGAAYGNPWQLVWVFDGDESTNVVCEGYAKAFQYLCDLTDFDGEVDCYTVSGLMEGGTGAGPHMWNIVRFGGVGGRSYLVDVTNSDEGTVGADGGLFLAGAEVYDQTEPPGYRLSLPSGAEITYWYSNDPLLGPDRKPLYGYEFNYNETDVWGNFILTLAEEHYDPGETTPPLVAQSVIGGVKAEDGVLTLSAAAAEKAHLLAAAYDRNRRFLDTVLLESLEANKTYQGSLSFPAEAVYFRVLLTGGENGSPLCPAQEAR